VVDAPRLAYRAIMVDVARNFLDKLFVFRLLDVMAIYKLNVLHLHLSDDQGWRLQVPALPELTSVSIHVIIITRNTFCGTRCLSHCRTLLKIVTLTGPVDERKLRRASRLKKGRYSIKSTRVG